MRHRVSPAVRAFGSEKYMYFFFFNTARLLMNSPFSGGTRPLARRLATVVRHLQREYNFIIFLYVYIQTGFPRSKSAEECRLYIYARIIYYVTCIRLRYIIHTRYTRTGDYTQHNKNTKAVAVTAGRHTNNIFILL